MGFFLRKSFKIAPGIRLNVSKSGLGLSAGVKGCRISTGPRGTYLNAGLGGVYYREKLDKKTRSSSSNNGYSHYSNQDYKINILSNYNNFVEISEILLAKEINEFIAFKPNVSKDLLQLYIFVAFICFLCCIHSLWFLIPACLLALLGYRENKEIKLKEKQNNNIKMELKNKAEIINTKEETKQLKDFFSNIYSKQKVYNADSGYLIQIGSGNVNQIVDNYVATIRTNSHYFFFNDNCLLIKNENNNKFYTILYQFLELEIIEDITKKINPDENYEVLSFTYEHVNKNGAPNKRYKENNIIAEVKCWIIKLKANDNFVIPLAICDKNIKEEFISKLNNLIKTNA